MCLYLKQGGMSYQEYEKNSLHGESNELMKSLDKRKFFLFADKARVYRDIDLRCEKMFQDTSFFEEILAADPPEGHPFRVCIGYKESIDFLSELVDYGLHSVKENKVHVAAYQKITKRYLDAFKARSRHLAHR